MAQKVRKVTLTMSEGLYLDAEAMKEELGFSSMSALVTRAVEEYVVGHGARLHREWMEQRAERA